MTLLFVALMALADDHSLADAIDAELAPERVAADFADQCDGHPWLCSQWRVDDSLDGTVLSEAAAPACETGDPLACFTLGLLAQRGLSGPKNAALAAANYQLACENGLAAGCWRLGKAQQRGLKGIPAFAEASENYGLACDGGYPSGCNSLGLVYQLGLGGSKDPAKALGLFVSACKSGNAGACENLGRVLQLDIDNGDVPLEQACDMGQGAACRQRSRSADEPATWLGRGCDLEDLAACGLLGLHTPDAEQAVTLLRKACGGGDWPSCPPLAKRVQGNDIMALLDRACMVGAEAEACMMLSDRYKRGEGVAKDKARAKDLASRANELGWEEGS